MKKTTKTLIAMLAILALVATACGAAADKISEKAAEKVTEKALEQASGGDANVDISGSGDDQTIKVETEDGSVAFGAGAELPDEITIPIPDGGTVQSAMTSDGSALASLEYDRDRYDDLISFYEDWVAGNGGDVWQKQTQSIETDGDTLRQTYWFNSESNDAIAVMDCQSFGDSEGSGLNAVCVSISQEEG